MTLGILIKNKYRDYIAKYCTLCIYDAIQMINNSDKA